LEHGIDDFAMFTDGVKTDAELVGDFADGLALDEE